MDIFEPWRRYREWLRGRRLSYPRLIILLVVLTVGFYGLRWGRRYFAALEVSQPFRCEFHQEVPLVEFVEDTEEIINTAVCHSDMEPKELWTALTDYKNLANSTYLPPSVEYAHYIAKPNDLKVVTDRWPEEFRAKYDLSPLKFDDPSTSYIYEEQNQIKMVFVWTVLAFRTQMANEAEKLYGLEFEQPDGLGSVLFYNGRFQLEPDPAGKGTRITFLLRQAMPDRLSGNGLLAMASRFIVMESYLEGFHPFMEKVIDGIERLARDHADSRTADASLGRMR